MASEIAATTLPTNLLFSVKVNDNVKGSFYGCVAAVSYGLNPVCALTLYREGLTPASVLFYRFAIGAALLALMMVAQRRDFSVTRREAGVLVLLGVLFAVSSLTYFLGFNYMSGGVAATLVFSYPVFTAMLMALFFGERLAWPSWLAVALTMGGIALLYKGDGKPIAAAGVALIMVSALSYALYIVVVNRSRVVMSSVKLTFYAMAVCLLCVALFASFAPGAGVQPLTTPTQWAVAFALGLMPTVVSLVFMAMAIKKIGSTPTAVMGALEPVTAVLLGALLFGDRVTPRVVAGVAAILVAVLLIILGGQVRAAAARFRVLRRGRLVIKRWRWK